MTADMTPRPTTFNGVKMRSRLEAGFAMWLDSEGLEWKYEPECFGSGEGQYLPDFLIRDVATLYTTSPLVDLYVEVKPTADRVQMDKLLKGRMQAVFDAIPDRPVMTAVASSNFIREHGPYLMVGLRNGATRLMSISSQHPHGIGLAFVYEPDLGPWYGEWWKGGDE